MRLNKVVLGLAVLTLMVPFAFACEPPLEPGYSPGYWKHNVRVYVEDRGSYSGGETAASMEYYASVIAGAHSGFTLEWANMVFWSKDKTLKSMWLTVANWFNAAAGLAPYP